MVQLAIIFPLSLLLASLIIQTCTCYDNQYCVRNPSSCGHIPNISFPFRLATDPTGCGHKDFELSCNNNVPVFRHKSLFRYTKYYVRSINYDNYTIRLFDASLAPLINSPTFFCDHSQITLPYPEDDILSSYDSGGDSLRHTFVVISCSSPLVNPKQNFYVDMGRAMACNSRDQYAHWYFRVCNVRTKVEDLEDLCEVELIGRTSLLPGTSTGNVSFQDVHNSLEYGFEISWKIWYCVNYNRTLCGYPAYVPSDGGANPVTTGFLLRLLDAIINKFEFVKTPHHVPIAWFPNGDYFITQGNLVIIALALAFAFVWLYVLLHAMCCLIGAPLSMALFVYKWRRRHLSFDDNIENFLQSTYDQLMPVRYSYRDIKKITKGFKDKLGEGGFGSVYKGKLRSGQLAAIKMLGKVDTNGNEFINEVATIGRVHHFNVVHLIGYCVEGSKRALIYPFMPNGSLDKYILSRERGDRNNALTITNEKMYEIALGVACGIEYLHRGCDMQILHFDIKPHNILLDENFVPKIADFGLAKLFPANKSIVSLTAIKGTIGYMAPEFFYRNVGGISYKADIYSFGRMLMEMAARKRDCSSSSEHSSQIFLPSWVHDQFNQGNEIRVGDTIEEEKEITKRMLLVGLWCVQLRPSNRPSMNKVIKMLQRENNTLELPPKPSFAPSLLEMNIDGSATSTISINQIINEPLQSEEEVVLESNVSQRFYGLATKRHLSANFVRFMNYSDANTYYKSSLIRCQILDTFV